MSFFRSVFLFFYRFVWMPFALTIVFIFLWPFHKKIQTGLRLRREHGPIPSFGPRPVWIHASSGEFEYAKPVITLLKKQNPDTPVVVTYFSPSYERAIRSFAGVDLALPLPFDLPGPVMSFLKKLNPAVLLIARTDLWPELLNSTRKLKIPSLLFSATFRPLSGTRALTKPYFRMLMDDFSAVAAVSEADTRTLKSLGSATPIETVGDTRYDQVLARLQNPKPLRTEIFTSSSGTPLFLAGSTWPEDEAQLLPAVTEHLRAGLYRLIVAPHEPSAEHLTNLEKAFARAGVLTMRYSLATAFTSGVLLIDSVGILAELYTQADFAFVGGSFKSKIHSVMEPLAAGLPVLVGPKHRNNREALEFQTVRAIGSFPAVTVVRHATEWRAQIERFLALKDQWPYARSAIRAEVQNRTGASARVAAWVAQHYRRDF